MKGIAAFLGCLGAVLTASCGGDFKNIRHDRHVIYSGSQEALRSPGVVLHPHDIVYEPCPDESLPPKSQAIKQHVANLSAGDAKTFGVLAWLDQVYIAGKDVQDGLANAEIMVLAEVDDGVRAPVRTIAYRIEDAREGEFIRLQERIPIFPLTPLGETPYRVRIRIIELDEGQESEVKTALDVVDLVGDVLKAVFEFVLPGGIVDLVNRAGAMDKNDVILDAGIDRIVPTLTLSSERRASQLRCRNVNDGGRPRRLWRGANGVCARVGSADGPQLDDLDFDPHKSFVIINSLGDEAPASETPTLWYAAGSISEGPKSKTEPSCPLEVPSPETLKAYTDTSYAVVRFEAALASNDKLAAEVVNRKHADYRQAFDKRVKQEGIRDAATIWPD